MPEPTKYITILREAFQGYYDFIINNGSRDNIFGDAYSNKIKPYVKILSPKGLLLTTPDGKQITSFEDVEALDKGLFKCWPYYTYKELDEKGFYTLEVVGGKESKIYPSWINRKENLEAYFYIQYAACLERLDNLERDIPLKDLDELEKLKCSEKQEQANFNWKVKDDRVCANGKEVSLTEIPIRLFLCLYKKRGNFVKREILEECWNTRPNYEHFMTNTMKKLENTLKCGLCIKEDIFKVEKSGKTITAYKLLP